MKNTPKSTRLYNIAPGAIFLASGGSVQGGMAYVAAIISTIAFLYCIYSVVIAGMKKQRGDPGWFDGIVAALLIGMAVSAATGIYAYFGLSSMSVTPSWSIGN